MTNTRDNSQGRRRGEEPPRRRSDRHGSSRSSGTGGSTGGTRRSSSSSRAKSTRTGRGTGSHTAARRTPPVRDTRATARGRAPARPAPKKRRWLRATVRIGLLVMLLLAIAAGITGCVLYNDVADSLPDPSKPIKGLDQTTKILDRKGKVIADLYADQNRTPVKVADIPKHVRDAVIATEDQRFYEHEGIDFLGMLRALWTDVVARDTVQGGSTITQQYVKTAFMTPERTIKRKVSEAVLAYRVEQEYTKDEILGMYLNTIYFGHGSYGIATAARAYFAKPVANLTVAEAATLAGVIKSPARYSPYLEPENALTRRNVVLGQMRDQGLITEAQYAEAYASPIKTTGLKKGSKIAPYFMEYIKEQIVKKYGSDAVYRSGLRVRTTIDLKMQKAAEAAVKARLNRKTDPSAAIVAIDPKTGEILAMVGGRDFASQQYNVAAQGRRQPGSSFKPFTLVTSLKQGGSPEATYTADSISIKMPNGKPWKVAGHGGGIVRLRTAMEKSLNPVFAQLVMKVGADEMIKTARAMGITTKITPVPAAALGGQKEGVSPLEMASAYSTLANGGKHMRPFSILEVRDAKGKVLEKNTPKGSKVLDADIAYLTTDILKGVITRGTATAAKIGRPAAGKTGTTQKNSDAWFVGYTPDLATAVWVGYPDSMRPMTAVHGIKVYGGDFPAEIWAAFMRSALAGKPKSDFKRPEGFKTIKMCLVSGQKAGPYCSSTGSGLFLADNVPPLCQLHAVPTQTVLPKLKGLTKDKAIALVTKLALKYLIVEREESGVTPGTVVDQNPAAGTKVKAGTVISIIVAKSPKTSTPPVPAFTISPSNVGVGTVVKFDASASKDDQGIKTWVWEFGDGAKDTTSGKTTTHRYDAPGTFEVTLWVTDNDGQTVTLVKSVVVK